CAQREYHDRGPGRSVGPGPAVPAAWPGGTRAPPGLLLPPGPGRDRRRGPDVASDGARPLPSVYVPDEDAKVDFYRRLARAVEHDEIAALRGELKDRFGPVPTEAAGLLVVSELRALGQRLGLETVVVR